MYLKSAPVHDICLACDVSHCPQMIWRRSTTVAAMAQIGRESEWIVSGVHLCPDHHDHAEFSKILVHGKRREARVLEVKKNNPLTGVFYS